MKIDAEDPIRLRFIVRPDQLALLEKDGPLVVWDKAGRRLGELRFEPNRKIVVLVDEADEAGGEG